MAGVVVFITFALRSNELQRVQQAASALWPDEISNGRLSRSEIIRRFTCAGTELLARLSAADRKALEEECIDSVSDPHGLAGAARLYCYDAGNHLEDLRGSSSENRCATSVVWVMDC